MGIDYKQKYLKYKIKYLNSKKKFRGGSQDLEIANLVEAKNIKNIATKMKNALNNFKPSERVNIFEDVLETDIDRLKTKIIDHSYLLGDKDVLWSNIDKIKNGREVDNTQIEKLHNMMRGAEKIIEDWEKRTAVAANAPADNAGGAEGAAEKQKPNQSGTSVEVTIKLDEGKNPEVTVIRNGNMVIHECIKKDSN